MNDALKRRVIGAILLVGVGVIILASLFGGNLDEHGQYHTSVTPRQAGIEQNADSGSEDASSKTDLHHDATSPEVASSDESTPVDGAQGSASGNTGESPPEKNSGNHTASENAKTAREVPDEHGNSNKHAGDREGSIKVKKDAGAAKNADSVGNSQAWLVQAASFRHSEQASTLIKRLSGANIQAHVAQAVVSGHPVYRVRLGPFHERARADKVAGRLQSLLGHAALVLKH